MAVIEHYRIVEVHEVAVESDWGNHQFRIEILQNLSKKNTFNYQVYIRLEIKGCNVVKNGFPDSCFRTIPVWVKFNDFPDSHYSCHTAEEALEDALNVCKSQDLLISFPDKK